MGYFYMGRQLQTKRIILTVLIVLFSVLVMIVPSRAASDMTVYDNSLASGWQDGSWGAAINFSNTSPVHSGSASIAATINSTQWGGLYLMSSTALDGNGYTGVSFWIHGGPTGGQQIDFKIIDGNDGNWDTAVSVTPVANTWTQVTVNLAQVANPATIAGLVWQDSTGGAQPIFYVDDIVLIGYNGPTPTSPAPGQGPALSVDAAAGQHPISPDIYGMNYVSETIAADLNLPVRRWGGNSTSRYNWQNGFTNTGSDWYYENIPGNSADNFVDQDRRTGTKTILTMPLIGWVSKNSPSSHPFDCGFKISKYGNQEDADWEWDADCGNGNYTNGVPITGNDPLDTSIAITSSYATGWVNHLTSTFGTAANGGVQFYNLDNEPMLWNSTHRDVHPNPTTYDEMRDKTWAYAAAIKAADPGAKTLGPVVWGWCAYFYSAADGCSPGPDHQSHGNVDFVEWYLQQMQAYEQQHGVRILDYVDVHIYPQIDGLYSENLGTAAVQAARLRSTRQLWDTTYVHEGWIGQPVYLIPRMKQWVANNYPATKLAITEYNWGALGYMNGALAQADLLGIFGREGLDLATLWGPPENANAPAIFAFRMYRNYDGSHSAFGDTSVQATSADQGNLAIYAALRSSDDAVTLMIINKTSLALTSQVSLAGFSPSNNAQVYRYSAANLTTIIHENDLAVTANGFSATFPGNSITLVIIPPSSALPATFAKSAPENAAVVLPPSLNLSWGSSSEASSYEYCYSSAPGPCTKWNSVGANTSVTLNGLAANYTYYWQVRAVNSSGSVEADGGTWWSFTIQSAPSCTFAPYTPPSTPSFVDVPQSHWAWDWIERYYSAGLTTGCAWVPGGYCPGDMVTREQMAVFIMRAKNCGNYTPAPVTGSVFSDVPASHWAAGFIRDFANEGITTGCVWVPGGYCPGDLVTREQMAVFLIRATHGGTYSPPAVTAPVFTDVPADHWAAAYIKQFYDEGITIGCAWVPGGYCPGDNVTREQMAVFIGRAFGLP